MIGGSKTAVILEYAEVIAPAGDPNFQSESDRAAVVTLHQWSFLPEIEKGDNVRCALRETRLVVVERVAGAVLGSGRRRDAL